MAELFECPSCGAALELDHDHDNLVQCKHCGKSVVVPESLRRKHQQPVQTDVQVITTQHTVTFDTPRTSNLSRILSCFLIFIVVFIIGTTVLSIAAPLVVTGLIARVLGDSSGILEGVFTTQVAGNNPQISLTLESINTLVATPTPPEAGFARQVLAIGGEGTGPGRFDDTRAVTVDSDGNIYTAEYSDHRVQKFSPDGKYITGWIAEGSNAIMSIAASRTGILYIASTGDVFKYDTQGSLIGKLEKPNSDYIEWLAITADNGLLAASDSSIYRFDANEQLVFQVEKAYEAASDNGSIIGGVTIDGLGNIYAPVQFTQQGKFKTSVFIYNANGEYSNRFGSEGDAPGQFRAFHTLAVDGEGRIYVTDIKGIQVFNPDGAYLNTIDVEGVAFGLWFDDAGALYVASNSDQVYKYEIIP